MGTIILDTSSPYFSTISYGNDKVKKVIVFNEDKYVRVESHDDSWEVASSLWKTVKMEDDNMTANLSDIIIIPSTDTLVFVDLAGAVVHVEC